MGLLISQCLESGRAFTGPQIHLTESVNGGGNAEKKRWIWGALPLTRKQERVSTVEDGKRRQRGGAKMGIKDFLIG